MKEKILNLLEENKQGLDVIEITSALKENSEVNNLEEIQNILYELEAEGLIVIGKQNRYRISNLIKGVVDMHQKGNAHIIVEGREQDIFIPKPFIGTANHKDIVLVKLTNEIENEGKIIKVIGRSLGNSLAEVVVNNGNIDMIPLSTDLPYNIIIEFDKEAPYVEGQIVALEYIKDIDKKTVLTKATKVITHKNAPDKDIKLIAAEFDIKLEFDEETLKEATQMPSELDEALIEKEIAKGRTDFRNEIIFTIDGIDTKDIDDAVCIKILPNGNYELGVHIADVSYYVKEGTSLWKEASIRGNSNYLGDSVTPMLPPELSNGICSLNPNVDRFTKSCIMEIDPSGKILNKRILNGIINSRKKMNYDNVQSVLDGETIEGYDYLEYILKDKETFEDIVLQNGITPDEAYSYNERKAYSTGDSIKIPCPIILKNMQILSKILRSNKHRRGKIDFESDEIKFIFDDNKEPIDVKLRVQREAEMVIEDFMIAANEAVATEIFDMNLPFVYRVHDEPMPGKIEDFINYIALLGYQYTGKIDYKNITSKDIQKLHEYLKEKANFTTLNKKLLRSMQKAIYDTANRGHFGIGSSCYTHFTSPIRRMSDLLVHSSINDYIINKEYDNQFLKKWESYLNEICAHISLTEKNSEKCEYAVDDMLSAKYMTKHIGEEYDAIIDTCLKDGFFVITDKHICGRVDLAYIEGEKLKYDETIEGYRGRKNRIVYMPGDKVRVECIGAYPETREIDFKLVENKNGNN